jgi:NAD(P)-dependent dehydrogenase (short-subunit alcohol dehydrogenase family)
MRGAGGRRAGGVGAARHSGQLRRDEPPQADCGSHPDDFDTIMAANLRSAFFVSQSAHAIMRAEGGGKIINIGSLTTLMGLGEVSVYG